MSDSICWINVAPDDPSNDDLRSAYDAVRASDGCVDNLYRAFSLRPHTIKPADDLYRAAMHHGGNSLPAWFSELIGSYVAVLTGCDYALAHHGHNYATLLGDRVQAETVLYNLRDGRLDTCGDSREVAALRYVQKLCLQPGHMAAADIEALSAHGWSDGEILEVAQIVAMFSYFTRVINGVGISLSGDRIGLY